MENLQIKVQGNKVQMSNIDLFNANESFNEEFDKEEYQEKIEGFKKNHEFEIQGKEGRLNVFCKGENTYINYSTSGKGVYISGRNLCRRFLV
jgi:hypothetical protein